MKILHLLLLLLPTPTTPYSTPKKFKRVAVIGSGIAGLTLAHSLSKNQDLSIHVFDKRSGLDYNTGAGIQLNGGMSVLHKIDPELFKNVKRAALPLRKIRSRSKPWFGGEPFSTLLELELNKVIREEDRRDLIVDDEVTAYTIQRGALQEVLMEELSPEVKVEFNSKLMDIRGDGEGIVCEFEDGKVTDPFDLVVGCDGIRSAVKEFIQTGEIRGEEADWSIYSGIRIQFAVQDWDETVSAVDQPKESELRQYFGDGAYALYGIYGSGKDRPPSKSAFLISRDEDYIGPFPKKKKTTASENVDWTQDSQSQTSSARTKFLYQIQSTNIPDVDIRPVVENANRFFELGVYFHNPFSFRGWSKKVKNSKDGYVVLCGDAAHAMPPFLGQGANQAIQDAYSLSRQISAGGDGKEFLKEYEKIRWKPTTDISLKAAFLGYLETGGEGFPSGFRDVFFRTMGGIGVAKKVFLDGATPRV